MGWDTSFAFDKYEPQIMHVRVYPLCTWGSIIKMRGKKTTWSGRVQLVKYRRKLQEGLNKKTCIKNANHDVISVSLLQWCHHQFSIVQGEAHEVPTSSCVHLQRLALEHGYHPSHLCNIIHINFFFFVLSSYLLPPSMIEFLSSRIYVEIARYIYI